MLLQFSRPSGRAQRAAVPPRWHSSQSASRTTRAFPLPPPSPTTAHANDLAAGCTPLQSPGPQASPRTSHTPSVSPAIPRRPAPFSNRAMRSPSPRSTHSSASRESLSAPQFPPLPALPTSLCLLASSPPAPVIVHLHETCLAPCPG